MQLQKTIFFIPDGATEVITIQIFTSQKITDQGYWNIDTNQVLLSAKVYAEFRALTTQKEQKNFFDSLKKVSSNLLG